MNQNKNNCNNYETCGECKSKFWMGELIQLDNWQGKGALCRECLLKIKIPCRGCSRFFNKIERFSDWEKGNYEQHEKVDRKKWEKEKTGEKCWPYIGCHYYIHGGQFCHKKECRGHFVPQHGHFCSQDCHDEWNSGTAGEKSPKYVEWKTAAEKLGWTLCQEKDLFRDWDNHPKLSVYKEKIRKKEGEKALACNRLAAPGEKYCFYCDCEKKGKKWGGDHRNNEKNWVKSYRDYWNLTNNKSDFPNNKENSNSLVNSSDNRAEKLEKQLIEAKRQRKSQEELKKLQSELENLNNNQQQKVEVKPTKNDGAIIWIGIFSGIILFVGTIILINQKKKKQ